MFLTLLFNNVISLSEFKDIVKKLFPDEIIQSIFLECVEQIYNNKTIMVSKSIDVFISEGTNNIIIIN